MKMEKKRGYADVISSLLLTAVVITVGLSVWGYAASASSVMSTDYFEEVEASVDMIKERFSIECIGVNFTSSPMIHVWVTNYGSVAVNITKVKIMGGGNTTDFIPDDPNDAYVKGWLIQRKATARIDFNPNNVKISSGSSISITVESEKVNRVYVSQKIP